MKSPLILPAIIALLLCAAGLGLFFIVQSSQSPAPPPQAAIAAPVPFEKSLEEILNGFLQSVAEKAQAYKSQRKMVVELAKPQNLAEDTYVQENYKLMETNTAELQTKMDAIMAVFKDTEDSIRKLAATQGPEKQKEIMDSWHKVRDAQANHYVTFFAAEQDIFQAYKDVMKFYQDKTGSFAYDATTDSLIFKNPADKPEEKILRDKITQLENQEAETLKQPAPAAP